MAQAKECKKCKQWFFNNEYNSIQTKEPYDTELCPRCNNEILTRITC